MGSDVTAKAVSHQIPRLKSIGKLQLQALEDGADPKDVVISTTVKDTQGQKLRAYFVPQHDFIAFAVFFLHLIIPAQLGTTLLMLRQTFPSTLARTVLPVA
jgi:hypothetical protein